MVGKNLPAELRQTLLKVTTASVASALSKRGIRNTWIRGASLLGGSPDRRVGRAFTLRFVPARSDLRFLETTRTAIEAMPESCIVVAGAMGVQDVGVVGDVLASRMRMRGMSAFVTDGAIRDRDGVLNSGLPVWCAGSAAPLPSDALILAATQEAVACGGVTVLPDDVVVCDADGAVVIPESCVIDIAREAAEIERFDGWVLSELDSGRSLIGLYPPDPDTEKSYQEWLQRQP